MKQGIFLLVFAAVSGAIAWRCYERAENPAAGASVVGEVKLIPAGVNEELARTGQAVRSEVRTMGDRLSDARLMALIKGKYILDSDLSILAISVECNKGEVRLTGSATSEEHIKRAVTLAQDTHGVHNVLSLLVVKN